MSKLSEDSEFTIPLKNLIAMVAITVVAATAYFKIEQRLAQIEFKQNLIWSKVLEHEEWIEAVQIPTELKQALEKQRELELLIYGLDSRLNFIENRKDNL